MDAENESWDLVSRDLGSVREGGGRWRNDGCGRILGLVSRDLGSVLILQLVYRVLTQRTASVAAYRLIRSVQDILSKFIIEPKPIIF